MGEILINEYPVGIHMYTGDAESYHREEGVFEVRYLNRRETFDMLNLAFVRYLKAKDAISLWDVTEDEQMVEAKCLMANKKNLITDAHKNENKESH